jgi:hypothetical protein
VAAAAAKQGLQPAEVYRVLETVSYRLDSAREENEAAWDTISDLSLQLRAAQEAKQAQAERLAQLEAAQAAAQLADGEGEAEGARLAARLAELASEVAAAKQAAAAVAPWLMLHPIPAGAAAVPVPFSNATFVLPAAVPFPPSPTATATSPAALYTFLAALACGALAALVYLRGRRAAAAEAARAMALGARLKEAAFAKDTAEQSLALLECELQRRMKQLEEAQQRAADAGGGGQEDAVCVEATVGQTAGCLTALVACRQHVRAPLPPLPLALPAASPRIGAGTPGGGLHTPGKGELPPPPAGLVEKFLRDHNFLAVQEEQMRVGGWRVVRRTDGRGCACVTGWVRVWGNGGRSSGLQLASGSAAGTDAGGRQARAVGPLHLFVRGSV